MISKESDIKGIQKLYATNEFNHFFAGLNEKTQMKFKQSFDIICTVYVLNTKLVKKLINTDLYEMRVSIGHNEYRTILFTIDNENIILSKNIVLLNGFLKKSKKDYERQIRKAEKIIKDSGL
ncbi:MAG: type II toxin-antitoxin system RelE/ParE family toxin [Bacteroidales bacterium]|jgi:hypothetical protein|nr:type II toxin-antitoxin system RelE/ParE family toxin [Bacteroidales bacterium]